MIDLTALFRELEEHDASDLHLRVGLPPRLRVDGELRVVAGMPAACAELMGALMEQSMHDHHRRAFERDGEVDCACVGPGGTRYRVNFFRDRNGVAASFRRIAARIRTLEELCIPEAVGGLARLRRGLVLVTGATGSGKTSTLAALVDLINRELERHVVTLEDPIEYVHPQGRSRVHQRAIGDDVPDFAAGVRDALRADADVLLIGEMRDLATTRAALAAAETGLLVFATLHTHDAAQSVDRIVDIFPLDEQDHVRAMLAEALSAVLSQTLLQRHDRPGRVPATELLIATPAIKALIREGRTQDIPNFLQAGREKGMWRLDDALEQLVREGAIRREVALESASSRHRFERRTPLPLAT